MAEDYDSRPNRPCMSCGQEDKGPRDVVGLPDGSVALFHKDCHAMLGCKICKEELEAVAGGHGPKGLKNEKLLDAIQGEMAKPYEERLDIYTRDDVTGSYQKALEEGRVLDSNWAPDGKKAS